MAEEVEKTSVFKYCSANVFELALIVESILVNA